MPPASKSIYTTECKRSLSLSLFFREQSELILHGQNQHAVPKTFFLSFVCVLLTINVCFGDNPIVQTNYTADPATLFLNRKTNIYLFI